MATFRVVAGFHEEKDTDGNVVRYGKDEEFESDHDLDTMFANKFVRVGEKTKRPRDLTEDLDKGGGHKVMDKPGHRRVNENEEGAEPGDEEDDDFLAAEEARAAGDEGVSDEAEQEVGTEKDTPKPSVHKAKGPVVKTVVKKPAAKASDKPAAKKTGK
jgi:hypothetical protein